MAGILDAHGGGYHPIVVDKGDDRRREDFGYGWIFALVIIFLALVFLWGRKDDGYRGRESVSSAESVLPYMAMAQMPRGDYGHASYENHQWDHVRDDLREFGNVRTEISDKAYALSDKMCNGFHSVNKAVDENRYDTSRQMDELRYGLTRQNDQNFFSTEKSIDGVKHQNAVDTRIILETIDRKFWEMEKSAWERERAELRDRVAAERLENSQMKFHQQRPYAVYEPSYC